MSIESLCTGDTVLKGTATHTLGAMGGDSRSYAYGAGLDCTVQTPSASAIAAWQARGQRLGYWVFFSTDPSLSPDFRLKWTVRAGTTLATPKILRVLDCYAEGRPSADLLWIADCEEVTTRSEQ